MKIQYPGVANSIDSDIENVRLLLDYTNLIPKGLYLDSAMKVGNLSALICIWISLLFYSKCGSAFNTIFMSMQTSERLKQLSILHKAQLSCLFLLTPRVFKVTLKVHGILWSYLSTYKILALCYTSSQYSIHSFCSIPFPLFCHMSLTLSPLLNDIGWRLVRGDAGWS